MKEDQVYSAAGPRELRAFCVGHVGTSVRVARPAHTHRHTLGSAPETRSRELSPTAGRRIRRLGTDTRRVLDCRTLLLSPLTDDCERIDWPWARRREMQGRKGELQRPPPARDAGVYLNEVHCRTGSMICFMVCEKEWRKRGLREKDGRRAGRQEYAVPDSPSI